MMMIMAYFRLGFFFSFFHDLSVEIADFTVAWIMAGLIFPWVAELI